MVADSDATDTGEAGYDAAAGNTLAAGLGRSDQAAKAALGEFLRRAGRPARGASDAGGEVAGVDGGAVGVETVAVVQYVGRMGARVLIVAPDGHFGDALVSSVDAGQRICADLGVPVRDWDRELTDRLRPSDTDRTAMGGRQL